MLDSLKRSRLTHRLDDFLEGNLVERLDQLEAAVDEFFLAANTMHGGNERLEKRALVALRFKNASAR
jgi:hypothetical protein